MEGRLDKKIINNIKNVLLKFDIDIKNLALNELVNKFDRIKPIIKTRNNTENLSNKNEYENIKFIFKRVIKKI